MKKDSTKLKTYLKNHTSLLFIFIALLVSLLNYLIYPLFIKNQLELVEVPIATTLINPTSLIKENMITTISINKNLLPDNVVTDIDDIAGKYVKNDYSIPNKSFFYQECLSDIVISQKSLLEENEVAYTLKFPGQYNKESNIKANQIINLYYFDKLNSNGENKTLVGKIKANVRVLSIIKDNEYDYLTIAINEDEIKYFMIAENHGSIIPLMFSEIKNNAFDVNATRSYLLEKGVVFSR